MGEAESKLMSSAAFFLGCWEQGGSQGGHVDGGVKLDGETVQGEQTRSRDVMALFSHLGRIYLLQQRERMDGMISLGGRGARFGRRLRHLECPMFKKGRIKVI